MDTPSGAPADSGDGKKKDPPKPPGPKLNFRAWLWMQHKENTEYAEVARLVLGGGPESIWVNKPLKAEQVRYDILSFFATGRPGITQQHVDQIVPAVSAYHKDLTSVEELVLARSDAERTAEHTIGMAAADAVHGAVPDLPLATRRTRWRDEMHGEPNAPLVYGESNVVRSRCEYVIAKNDPARAHQCGKLAVLGQVLCDMHGGSYLDSEETKNLVRLGQEKIILATSAAIDTVIDIMQNSVQDPMRLKAAEMLLDRGGLPAGMPVEPEDSGATKSGLTAAEEINDRLKKLGSHGDGPVIIQSKELSKPEEEKPSE